MDAHKHDWLNKTTDFAVANGKDGCFAGWPQECVILDVIATFN